MACWRLIIYSYFKADAVMVKCKKVILLIIRPGLIIKKRIEGNS